MVRRSVRTRSVVIPAWALIRSAEASAQARMLAASSPRAFSRAGRSRVVTGAGAGAGAGAGMVASCSLSRATSASSWAIRLSRAAI